MPMPGTLGDALVASRLYRNKSREPARARTSLAPTGPCRHQRIYSMRGRLRASRHPGQSGFPSYALELGRAATAPYQRFKRGCSSPARTWIHFAKSTTQNAVMSAMV